MDSTAENPTPPRPGFAWGTFFLGIGVGVAGMVLMLVGLAVLAALFAARLAVNESASEGVLSPPSFSEHATLSVYGEADPAWTLYTLKGEPVKLGDYRGKVVFVNFWATWCGPCVMEMPSIQRLQEKMKDTPVVFLLISDENTGTIDKFLKKKAWALQSLRRDGPEPAVFRSQGIPATFIVNPSGMVVYRHVGSARWDADDVVKFLRGLL